MNNKIKTQVVVIGGGPSGYSAAFRCVDLGLNVILIERYSNLGGVCLNVGCIPSKTLLHIVKIIQESKYLVEKGIISNDFDIDINKIRTQKEKIVNQLTHGLTNLAKMRKLKIINGYGKFINSNIVQIRTNEDSIINVDFDFSIIATGSRHIKLPFVSYEDYRIWNSTTALSLKFIPERLLIIGGGIIGIEIATIYSNLGSKIDIIEMSDQILPTLDEDIVKIFTKYNVNRFNLMTQTKIKKIELMKDNICVYMLNNETSQMRNFYNAILIAVGRKPNSDLLDIDKAGIQVNNLGYIIVDKQMRTNIENIFAIGDVIGQPMLAHKGSYEGHIAAEVIAGNKHYFDPKVIPFIVYSDPEIAWAGITEKIAIQKNICYRNAIFPWQASGRAVSSGYQNGITKLIFEKRTNKIIGGIVLGANSSELLGEISLAIEMCCDAEDISLTMHAHPTLYESIGLAAKVYDGSITDLLNFKN